MLDSTDTCVGEQRNRRGLAVGDSYGGSATVRLEGLNAGDYYILVSTDTGRRQYVGEFGGEGDNLGVGPVIHVNLPPPPDLVVESVSAPGQAFSGSRMVITYRVRNVGQGRVRDNWHDGIYLSADDQLDGGDIRVGLRPQDKETGCRGILTHHTEWTIPKA